MAPLPPCGRTLAVLCGKSVPPVRQTVESCLLYVGLPTAVRLICTPQVETRMEALAAWLRRRLPPECPVSLLPVSGDLPDATAGNSRAAGDAFAPGAIEGTSVSAAPASGGGRPSIREVYAALEAEPLALSLDGGTNFMNCDGLLGLRRTDGIFLQSTRTGVFVTRQNGASFTTSGHPLPPPLPARDLLDMQGIAYECLPTGGRRLKKLCAECKVPLPEDALFDLRIGGRFFDCVWNSGSNRLCLLAWPERNRIDESGAILADTRDMLSFALDKDRLEDLYDRKIYVLEWDRPAAGRLNDEGRGKIEAHCVYGLLHPQPKAGQGYMHGKNAPAMHDVLCGIFTRRQPPGGKTPSLPKLSDFTPESNVLVTALGPNPLPTLKALAAFTGSDALLCCTPDNASVGRMAGVLRRRAADFGLKAVHVLAAGYEGTELPRRLPEFSVPAVVNCTPGTKGQGAFLTLWAAGKGHEVWALPTEGEHAICLSHGYSRKEIPVLPIPLLLDCLVETSVLNYGWGKKAEDWKRDGFYRHMLRFFKAVDEEGLWDVCMPADPARRKAISSADYDFRFVNDKCIELSPKKDGAQPYSCLLGGGGWYERLTAKAIAGLDPHYDVAVNVDIAASAAESGPSHPANNAEAPRRMTERDVLVSARGGRIYVVSCKSFPLNAQDLAAAARQARAAAETFGRFTVPLLHSLFAGGITTLEGVTLFGPDTLCRPEALREALRHAEQLVRARGEKEPA